ncbi:MAG TPA: PAS domain S-box protein [Thermoanaerobaculia bacterium]|nr:PAS domain S-box protein [Thermoanaerobaculia bacterium]
MRLLLVEDNPYDAELTIAELRRFGFAVEYERVDTIAALTAALDRGSWSAILSDFNLPAFNGRDALDIVRQRDREIPFIVVSGTLGEERAVDIIRAGANDYVSKDRLSRLGPALERELRDVQLREERRTLFTALRRSEDRYRRVFENAPVGVAISTPDGVLLAANRRFSEIVGKSTQEIVGRRMSHFTSDAHAAARNPERTEQRIVRNDGEVVWAAITVAPITSDHLQVEQLVWLVEDVTAQKQHEAELGLHKAQLEEAQRMAHIGSYELDLQTGRRVWSPELFRIFGLDPQAKPDLALIDARVHPEDVGRVHDMRRRILETSDALDVEYRINVPGRGPRVVHDRGHFVSDEQGRALKIVGVVQDVTDTRRQAEEIERRNVQQVEIANLGQAALSAQPIESLIAEAAEIVTRLLDVDCSTILQDLDGRFTVAGVSGMRALVPVGAELAGSIASQATYTVATGTPIVVGDLRNETRFTPSRTLLDHGIASVLTVPISTARTAAWGTLAALSREPRTFSTTDVDFLRSIATVLAQALERDRVDQQLVLHAAQQSAIAELSRVALNSVDDAIHVACSVVSDVLSAEHVLFFELDEAAQLLRYRSGRCWAPAAEMDLRADGDSAVAEAVRSDSVVRFSNENVPDAPVAAGVVVPVSSTTRSFGALSANSKQARVFIDTDLEFLQSIANIIADAMERERARRALAASEERHREVIEGATEVIFTVSTAGIFTSLNAAFTNITGWSAADWIGRPFIDLLHPDDAPRVAELFGVVLTQQESFAAEMRIVGRKGAAVLELTSFPKIEDGQTTAVYGFARDVTEERRIERERQRLTRNLQLLLESTVEGIITVDLGGRCTMSNRAAAEMLGRQQEEMAGSTLQALLNADERAAIGQIVAVARSGEVRSVSNGTFYRADGTAFPVEYSAAPISDAGVRIGVVISFSDITVRRKLEAKLEQADRLSSLGRLAATVAHEFNNVLMGISPFVELLRRGGSVETSLDHIGRAVARGKRITQDILRFTQPAHPVRASIDVGPWLENVTLEARSLMTTCKVQSSVEPNLRIDGDANQLQQMFTNLILNARDAMPYGGTLTIAARHEALDAKLPFPVERPERFAHIVVSDTGVGMSAETQRHIFEPLFTTKQNGTGLGLPVTHQVVQRHGGDIFVESALGSGTTFHIFLPLAEDSMHPSESAETVTAPPNAAHRVLLVEDDITVAAGLVMLLELEGLEIEIADTGAEALRRVDEFQPDVVVLDVGLPDMDGTHVYAQLAERHPNLAVVFSTGHADRAKLDTYLELPHVGFLLKPYESSDLLEAIREVVA